MKIVLFGEDLFTATALQSLIEAGNIVQAVVVPLYEDNLQYKALRKLCNRFNIEFHRRLDVNDEFTTQLLIKLAPDILLSVHLRKILLKKIFSIPRRGAINVHPSLLPRYRGLSPQHQALINGDKETGVTVHFLEEAADTGDIIAQKNISLSNEDSIYDLQVKMLSVYAQLIPKVIKALSENDFTRIRQDERLATWCGPLKDSDRKIDLKKTKFAIYNLVRAVSKPYKGAYIDGFVVWACAIPDKQTQKMYLREYKQAGVYRIQDKLLIRMNDGVLLSDDFETVVDYGKKGNN